MQKIFPHPVFHHAFRFSFFTLFAFANTACNSENASSQATANLGSAHELVSAVPSSAPPKNSIYDEELSSILDFIVIDASAAQALNLRPGNYSVASFANVSDETEAAIVVGIDLPDRNPETNDAWVMSQVHQITSTESTYQYSASDFHGHTFSFQITLGEECFQVLSAKLNGVNVELHVKTYLTDLPFTCGFMPAE